MIDTHYATLRIVERWDWNRYVRLCQFLQYTPWELASLVMIRHQVISHFQRRGRLCGAGHRAAALVLTLLEAHCMAAWTKDVIRNPFPNLSIEPPPLPPKGVFPARKPDDNAPTP